MSVIWLSVALRSSTFSCAAVTLANSDLRLSDPRGEASQARRDVARQIFELGEVKQSFPPTTQVSELLLKRLGP